MQGIFKTRINYYKTLNAPVCPLRSIKAAEAVAQMCYVKKVFLEISRNLQENTCDRVFFLIKLQAWGQYQNLKIRKFKNSKTL